MVRGSSYYASPITLVKKPDKKPRVCIDYTRLNKVTRTLNYPLPLIGSLRTLIAEKHKYFSVLDLRDAYNSLPLTPRASERAGITTSSGLYLPKRTPFGLKNAPSKFSEMMTVVIEGLTSFVYNYLDDFLVFSETLRDHLLHFRQLLKRLKKIVFFFYKQGQM